MKNRIVVGYGKLLQSIHAMQEKLQNDQMAVSVICMWRYFVSRFVSLGEG